MDKPKLHTPDFTEANIAKIAELFPSCVVEAKDDKTGELRRSIDFDQLRQELSDHIVEGPQERYRLDWPGKREALLAANAPIAKTLRPVREESVDFDTTQNLFLEGDNLDGLKLLQETYLGKVKVAFIDPPYNTGNDFIYDDDFSEDTDSYFKRSNQKDADGSRMHSNNESNGRFHSDWLTLMYARIRQTRNLLSDDGFIAIAIDDNELPNLRKICDEVFGESNFIGNVVWKHTQQSKNDERYFSRHYNIIVIYRKSDSLAAFSFPRTEADNKNYKNPDNDPKGKWRHGDVRSPNYRSTLCYEVATPSGKKVPPPEKGWRWSKETLLAKLETGEAYFNSDETSIARKIYLCDQKGRTPENIWSGEGYGTTRQANAEIKDIFDNKAIFDTPKPTALIKRLCGLIHEEKDFVVLDFFAGSSTTAHAVMQLNAEDGGNRRFIMVQLPEACDEKSEAFKAGYKNIAEISKERIRRVGAEIKDEIRRMKEETEGELLDDNTPRKSKTSSFSLHPSTFKNPEGFDTGFRVLKVDTSNVKDIYYAPDEIKQDELGLQVDHIKEDRTAEDLLFQVMLDWGVDLSLPVTPETIRGKQVYFVDENAIAACFETGIDEDFVKELAKRQPLRAVFRDTGYADDAVKINIGEIFKLLSPGTELKTL